MARFAGTGRTPGQAPRSRRNWDRLGDSSALIDSNSAIQLNALGKLVFVIGSGEPFSQSSSGFFLTLTTSTLLTKQSSSLEFNDDELYSQIAFHSGIMH